MLAQALKVTASKTLTIMRPERPSGREEFAWRTAWALHSPLIGEETDGLAVNGVMVMIWRCLRELCPSDAAHGAQRESCTNYNTSASWTEKSQQCAGIRWKRKPCHGLDACHG